MLDDARGICELGPLAAPCYQRRIAPFLSISMLIVVGIAFNTRSSAVASVLVAGSIASIAAATFVPWRGMPRWTHGAFVVASLPLVGAVMRASGADDRQDSGRPNRSNPRDAGRDRG